MSKSSTRYNPEKVENHRPYRLINRNGTMNIKRPRVKNSIAAHDSYHALLAMSWAQFLLFVVISYLTVNFIFAIAYFACGPEGLGAAHVDTGTKRLLDDFFFSVQTFATIGYGKLTPETFATNILVTIEALLGLLSVALATGLLFARFARPTSRVVFSNSAVILDHDGVPSFVFRIANERFNQIVEAQARAVLSISEQTLEGDSYRTLYDLELERSSSPIFGLSWTVVHPITRTSPLFGKTQDDLAAAQAEIICTLVGIDDTFSQTIHARHSYVASEIFWNRRFKDILSREFGMLTVDIDNLHTIENLDRPQTNTNAQPAPL